MNTLVALSQVAGNLDYDAYVQYLTQQGHLRNPQPIQGVVIPAEPTNSSLLQVDRGDRTDSLTDYRPDQALWSQDNLPEIIYIFDKPNNWLGKADLMEPPTKSYPIYGKLLRDIPILPDHISPDLEGWRYEAFCRFDPRIKKEDIVNRMPPQARGAHNNDLSMRTIRFRRDANVLGWVAKGGKFAEDKLRIQGRLQAAGVPLASNTTRGVTWGARPNGRPIPVPAKLRWDNCVEPAPAQAPLVPVMPAFVAAVPGSVSNLVPAATSSASASTASSTVPTNTIPSLPATNIPVTQASSAHGTRISAPLVIPHSSHSSSPSSSQSRAPHLRRSAAPQNISQNSGPSISVPNLDPRLLRPSYPPGQHPTVSTMNPPPSSSQAGATASAWPSIPMPTTGRGRRRDFAGAFPDSLQAPPRLAAPRPAPSSAQGAAGPSSTVPITIARQDRKRKRKRDDDDEERDPNFRGHNNERPIKRPRSKAQVRFRTRWPRTAFGGVSEDMPQSLNECVQQANASHVVSEAASVNNEQIQPAHQGPGHHGAHLFVQDGNGDVVAAPEDSLGANGVDAGRLRRVGNHVRERNGGNAGGLLWVEGAEGVPVDYSHMDRSARPEAVSAPRPVEYGPQVMGCYLPHLPEGECHVLAQDPKRSAYPSPE